MKKPARTSNTKAKTAPKAKAKAKAKTAPKAKAKAKAKTAPKPKAKAKAKAASKEKAAPKAKAAREALRPRPEARSARPARATPAPTPPPLPAWQPYPKLRRAQLTDAQAAWLEQAIAEGRGRDLARHGLFQRDAHNRRFLAGAPGPSDTPLLVGDATVPLWNAVADVASGHADHATVLAAFRALPPGTALAAWEEIARGDAYDLFAVHPRTPDDAGVLRTPETIAHRARFFGWMADASLAMGAAGRRAALALAAATGTDRHGAPEAFIALLALARHARAAGHVLDAAHDPLVATLEGEGAEAFAAPVVQEIYDAIPEDRAAWLPPIRT